MYKESDRHQSSDVVFGNGISQAETVQTFQTIRNVSAFQSSFSKELKTCVPAPLPRHTQVSLTIWDQDTDSVFELALKTQQASDMASIILDHINAIMANSGRN